MNTDTSPNRFTYVQVLMAVLFLSGIGFFQGFLVDFSARTLTIPPLICMLVLGLTIGFMAVIDVERRKTPEEQKKLAKSLRTIMYAPVALGIAIYFFYFPAAPVLNIPFFLFSSVLLFLCGAIGIRMRKALFGF